MKILSYLIVVFLAPAIILLSFRLLVFNHNYYQKEFENLGVYEVIEKNTAIQESQKLIDYFCCNGQLDLEFFTQREILHHKIFPNDLWRLPPESNLLKLFPPQFFQDFANRIVLQSLLMLVIIYLLSVFLSRRIANQ